MKTSTLTRKTPMPRGQGFKAKSPKPTTGTPRPKKCAVRGCREKYTPDPKRPYVRWCSEECGAALAVQKLSAQKAKAQRQERAADKVKREGMKGRNELIAEAQKWFNTVVRLEDSDKPCISCGRFVADDGRPGGVWDAGHYLTRGSSPHLRFDRRNVHKQCKGCNRPGGTTRAAHRAGVEARIGIEALEELEADQASRDYTKDDLRQMRDFYRKRAAYLKKGEN